jgi:hypothetical protein
MSDERKKPSRSTRLRKYESVYESCLTRTPSASQKAATKPLVHKEKKDKDKKEKEKEKKKKERRPSSAPPTSTKVKTRTLTDYQKFVKTESKKGDYHGLSPADRMREISKAWRSSSSRVMV